MKDVPVHGRLEDRPACPSESGDNTGERGRIIVLDAAFPGRVAVAVQNVDLTEGLVRVVSDVG